MKKILFTLLFISSITSLKMSACSCINVPETFSANIKANHVIFMGTVLEHIKIPNDSNYLMIYHGLTKIHVIKWYQNQMESDTIFYANGSEAMCTSSIEYMKLGKQIIIKAVKESINEPGLEFYYDLEENYIRFMDFYNTQPIVAYDICDVSLLEVKEEIVIGNITKNYQKQKWKRIRFIDRISERWAEKLESKLRSLKNLYQTWSLHEFGELMQDRWNSL